MVEVSKSKTE